MSWVYITFSDTYVSSLIFSYKETVGKSQINLGVQSFQFKPVAKQRGLVFLLSSQVWMDGWVIIVTVMNTFSRHPESCRAIES